MAVKTDKCFYRGLRNAILPSLLAWACIVGAVLLLTGCTVSTDSTAKQHTTTTTAPAPAPLPIWQQQFNRYLDNHPSKVTAFCRELDYFGEARLYRIYRNTPPDLGARTRTTFDLSAVRCGGTPS